MCTTRPNATCLRNLWTSLNLRLQTRRSQTNRDVRGTADATRTPPTTGGLHGGRAICGGRVCVLSTALAVRMLSESEIPPEELSCPKEPLFSAARKGQLTA